MTEPKENSKNDQPPAGEPPEPAPMPVEEPSTPVKERLDPTRYGDWELNGKCVDF